MARLVKVQSGGKSWLVESAMQRGQKIDKCSGRAAVLVDFGVETGAGHGRHCAAAVWTTAADFGVELTD